MTKATRQELEALAAKLESRIQYEIAACESVGRSPSILFSLDELRAILCLAAHAGEQKPVAYLYRWNVGGEILTWRVSEDRQKVPASFDGIEEIPLYLNPAPTSVGAMREALERAAEGWTNAIELGLLPPQHVMSATILRDEALAALSTPPQDVVEGIARIIDPDAFNDPHLMDDLTPSERHYIKINQPAKRATATAKAIIILASGLVTAAHPDEAAIRADEREKCARLADDDAGFRGGTSAAEAGHRIAAAIRAGGAK